MKINQEKSHRALGASSPKLKILFLAMIFVWFFVSAKTVRAATVQVSCSSSATVNSALASARSGDIVQCTNSAWTTGTVALPNNKQVTLDGNGLTLTGGSISIPSSATYQARVTNFIFKSNDAVNTGGDGDSINNLPWRIDHCTFDAAGTDTGPMLNTYVGPGLIDHCNFINIPGAKETSHDYGWGAGNLGGWTNIHAPGSYNAIYFEDNTVATNQSQYMVNLAQNYYGARIVVRYTTFSQGNIQVDVHGNNTGPSGRWWEFYGNNVSDGLFCLRGGSGLIFNNTGGGAALFVNETADNKYGIGKGQNNSSYPAYLWNNGSMAYLYNQDGCSFHNGTVTVGTDVRTSASGTILPGNCTAGNSYWKTDEGGNWDTIHGGANDGLLYKCTAPNVWTAYYKPFTYPYPLTTGGMPDPSGSGTSDQTPPAAPTGLSVS